MQWKQLWVTILQKCIVLPIQCEVQDTALTIFSTLNDRGLPLADSDIFKAQIYRNLIFKIAIVVDMWLTGFDVPFLDSIYIDKPIQQHNLIQTISRVNRKFEGKNKGLVVDYIGIKKQMNLALKKYSEGDKDNFEDIAESIIIVRNHLDLLAKLFHKFDSSKYFKGILLMKATWPRSTK